MLIKDENFKIIVVYLIDFLKVEGFYMCFCNCQDYVDFIYFMMEVYNEDMDNIDGRRGILYIIFLNKIKLVFLIIYYLKIM